MAHCTTSRLRLSRAATIRSSAVSFCQAFTTSKPPTEILNDHFIPDTASQKPSITEHGPSWAASRLPFLGHTFSGRDMCLKYFELLGQVLTFEPAEDTFPPEDGFVVDENAVAMTGGEGAEELEESDVPRGVVTLVAKGKFRSVKTGRSWQEKFTYRLSGFDEEGRIGHWEIWADPLSAWVAVGDDEAGRMDQRMED